MSLLYRLTNLRHNLSGSDGFLAYVYALFWRMCFTNKAIQNVEFSPGTLNAS